MNPFVPILVVAANPFVPILVVAARVAGKFLAKSPDFPFDVSVLYVSHDTEPATPKSASGESMKTTQVQVAG